MRAAFNLQIAALAVALLPGFALPLHAQRVMPAEAREAAQGWVKLIERAKGHWGTAVDPNVGEVVPMQVSNRVVGYYCPVMSGGYVVLSLHRGLVPVRAYSVTGSLSPQETRGPAALVRDLQDRAVRGLEQRIGSLDAASPVQFQSVVQRDYRPTWKMLQDAAANPGPGRAHRPAFRARRR